ncbi:MAG: sulfatase-like hydrolase/transferase [Clostridia bacterium]|nr:sulfatase-like hydrolase/transferase [Clostridia bacterium]
MNNIEELITDEQSETELIIPEKETETKQGFFRKFSYIPLLFISYIIIDFAFRYTYKEASVTTEWFDLTPSLFTIGWSIILTCIAVILPKIGKRIFIPISIILNIALCLVHGVMYNIFAKFFSFSDMGFADDGFAFLEKEYISFPPILILFLSLAFALGILAFIFVPKQKFSFVRLIVVISVFVVGVGTVFAAKNTIEKPNEDFSWENYYDIGADYSVYDSFDNPVRSMYLTGLYQYTFRNFNKAFGIYDVFFNSDNINIVDEYIQNKTTSNNEYTGILEGKNLIMIQLEAIDSWMLTEAYMPNLYAVMSKSVNFDNYFSSIFIAAGTFNAEYVANTGIIPSSTSVSQSVYTNNSYPYSMANLFKNKGYTVNSFHGSEGDVYNRSNIHKNLGFEHYYGGKEMKMQNYQMDRFLIEAYDKYVRDDSFFSFIITFSGHGPYNDESLNTSEHIVDAKAVVDANLTFELSEKDLQNYYYAVAHAMETDLFVGELFERLSSDGHIEDTVVIFYTDHFNYYYGNDSQIVKFKGVEDTTMAQRVPFFIYSADLEPQTISKVVSGIDILPTVCNLFNLEVDRSIFVGDDVFSEDGGYVPFKGYSWYDGEIYYIPGVTTTNNEKTEIINEAVNTKINVCASILKSDYYGYYYKKHN